MQLRQAEELQRQRKAIAFELRHIAAAHQAVEHAVELVRAAVEALRYFRLRQAVLDAGQQFQNVETLVERRGAVAVCVIHVHVRSPMNDSCIYADGPFEKGKFRLTQELSCRLYINIKLICEESRRT